MASHAGIPPPVRVAIAASHTAVRGALHALVWTDHRMDLVATVHDDRAAQRCLLQHHPDVLALALNAALADGGRLIRRLRAIAPETAVVVASTASTDAYRSLALAAGATALVALDGPPEHLLDAVHAAAPRLL